jgi:WD40 repeat protein
VRWNNDGTKFASGSNDNTVKIWNPATGEQPCQLKVDGAVICLAFSPTEDLIAACDHLGNILFLNTTGEKTLSPVTPVTSVHGRVSSIDFAPCGTKLACVLTLYSGSLCRHSVKIFTKERSTGNFVCQSTVDVDGAVSSIDFAPCGTKIAAAFSIVESRYLQPLYNVGKTMSGSLREGGVKIFNSETGALLCTLEGHDCKSECLCSKTSSPGIVNPDCPVMERRYALFLYFLCLNPLISF